MYEPNEPNVKTNIKKSKPPTTHSIPGIVYWNFRLQAKKWEQSQSTLIQEALLEWMNSKSLKTNDWFEENPSEFQALYSKWGEFKFRDGTLSKLKDFKGISINKFTAFNLKAASLQVQRPMAGILAECMVTKLEITGHKFLPLSEARRLCLEDDCIQLTGEMVDSSEGERTKTEDIFDKLLYKLDKKGLIKEGQRYTYDDLLAIKSESEETVSPEVESEATEAMERINKLLNKEGGEQK